MSQKEKFEAIRKLFPRIPSRDLSRIAEKVVLTDDLSRIGQIVGTYVRHVYTAYDSVLNGKQYYSSARAEAREEIKPKVLTVLNSWR